MQHTVCSSVTVASMRLTRRGGICQPTRQLKGSGHDRHDEAHPRHSSTGRVGNSGAWWGIVGAAPCSSDVLARTNTPGGSAGGGQSPCFESHAIHRPGTAAGRRPDESEVKPSGAPRRRARTASAEHHPEQASAPLYRTALDWAVPAADGEIVPLSWEGDVRVTSPSRQGAPMETGAIGVIFSGRRLLERSRSDSVDPRNDVPSLRRVTFRVTSELHHPPEGRVSTWG
jgi:hypothetical protein